MLTIQVQSQVSLDELLHGVEQLSTPDFEHFVEQVLSIQAKRYAPSLPKVEAELLQKINQGAPPAMRERLDELNVKRRTETLIPSEYQELLNLIAQIEQMDAERVQYLGELAKLRGVSIRTLMNQLGIRRPAYA
ncbi:MAG: hypothetical protein U0350_15500 [Caldilineaceae bacterium]